MTRVTVEHDNFRLLREVKTFYNLRHVFGNAQIRWSNRMRGLHIKSHGAKDFNESLHFRELYGDDKVRVRLDCMLQHKAKNILFTPKVAQDTDDKGWTGDIWSVIPETPLLYTGHIQPFKKLTSKTFI